MREFGDGNEAYGGIAEKSNANRMLIYLFIGSRTIIATKICLI